MSLYVNRQVLVIKGSCCFFLSEQNKIYQCTKFDMFYESINEILQFYSFFLLSFARFPWRN